MATGNIPSILQLRSGPERSLGIGAAILIYNALHQPLALEKTGWSQGC